MYGENRVDNFSFFCFETIHVILHSNDIGDGGVAGRE